MVLINLLEDWTPQYREPATLKDAIEVAAITLLVSVLISVLVMALFNAVLYFISW
jgi:hypothetical protein